MAPSGKWIGGIGPDSNVEEAAQRSLEARLSAVHHWLPLAAYLAEQDVEHVHRLRVTTRRAVAAIELYDDWLPGKRSRRMKKRLKKIRRAAGKARDLDVLCERLHREYGERVDPIVAMLAERRTAVQPAIVKTAERYSRRDRFVRGIAKLLSGIRPPEKRPTMRFGDWAGQRLAESAADFFAALPDDSADMDALHQFRIRAKALRYTIELVAAAFGSELRHEHYPVVEKLQGLLGKIQDHVTAANHLREWADEAADGSLQEPLREFAAEESARLDGAVSEFRTWWTADRAQALRRGLMPEASSQATPVPQAADQT